MPPSGFRKRLSPPKSAKSLAKRAKPTLFDTVDAPTKRGRSVQEKEKLLEQLNDDDDDESLSEADSDDFEVVPTAKRRKTSSAPADEDGEDDDEDSGMIWEDAIGSSAQPTPGPITGAADDEIADVSFSIKDDGIPGDEGVTIPGLAKKGPSKREKKIRIESHCLHVQALMWHNTVRNSWLNDKEVQKTLIDGLTEGVKREVTRYREAMGTLSKGELEAKKKAVAAKGKGKRGQESKDGAGSREWTYGAQHLEQGVPNLSGGDPLLRLLKVLSAYWRKRFTITAPGLRKQGYMPIKRLRDEIKYWEKNKMDAEEHGERIESLEQFRKLTKEREGSRDVGAQLFCALFRGLGLETRMVANLQPVGFGFSKAEEAAVKKTKKKGTEVEDVLGESDGDVLEVKPDKKGSMKRGGKLGLNDLMPEKPMRKSSRGKQDEPIDLDDSDSPLSSAPGDTTARNSENDDEISVIDVTPQTPKPKPNKKYDRDLTYPNYWIEVCSPLSHKYIPVDPIVCSTIAPNDDLLQSFEPRGKKAEKGKQVMCYTIAFSSDGTAKDVTVRYLRKHYLPGKTKGTRIPVEKVPIYNRKGKVRRYEEYDWFRTLMSIYARPEAKRTAADDLEEQTSLMPRKPGKEEGKEVERESLQGYKQSAEFVLEQHLRREEAIVRGAEPVKTFTAGRGLNAKEHPVYRRQDVVSCKTVESWHKEGRALREGEHPLKLVPMRAVTLIRKREMEDALKETGEKLKQGLYSREQTDWIIPPPIKNGVIPKNAFGNMDVYVSTMVPKGAVHLPLKGAAKLCRKLEVDYAEACTGFEFGKQRAVPVLTGVVIAEEHEILVRDAWRAEQVEAKRKEDTKRTGVALHWWRKMLLGLPVLERMRIDYADHGGNEDEANPFVKRAKEQKSNRRVGSEQAGPGALDDEDRGGGFLAPGHDEEEVPRQREKAAEDDGEAADMGGGVFADSQPEDDGDGDGDSLVEEDPGDWVKAPSKGHMPVTPVSLQSLHKDAEDDEEGDGEMDVNVESITGSVPTRTPRGKLKAPAKAKGKVMQKRRKKAATESFLSELENTFENHSDPEGEAADADDPLVTSPVASRSGREPSLVIAAANRTPQSKPRQSSARKAKKSTALRSKYFAYSGPDDDKEQAEDGEEEGSEPEVVKPRATTARTRGIH